MQVIHLHPLRGALPRRPRALHAMPLREAIMSERKPSSPLSFKVHSEEYREIHEAAGQANMTISAYIRSKLLNAPITASMFKRFQMQQLMMKLLGRIGKVGSDINQIAWKLNKDQPLTPADVEIHKGSIKGLKDMRDQILDCTR